MQDLTRNEIDTLLQAVGELLEAEDEHISIVIVGGASLNLLGLVPRTTQDVDVIARVQPTDDPGASILVHPDPMPESLVRAIQTVARDFSLPSDWMNTEIAAQWLQGLPPTLPEDITWRTYGALRVGLAGRQTLITLKLFASADRGPTSVHYQDLVRLQPNDEEL
ncbi:MAG TPA: DUF6036 family nucleotidyltransferase, partial [Rhodothermales bacterium]|nr:DUF6036 family nucleotidyltransferase [Rhodothermales bacterium]